MVLKPTLPTKNCKKLYPKEIHKNVDFKTINGIKEIDSINIYEDNFTLVSLGSIERINEGLFLNCFKLKNLGNLTFVKNDCNIRNSILLKIENIEFGKNLNLSNSEIKILKNVKVRGTLILPSHLKGKVDFIKCDINKLIHRKSNNKNTGKKFFYNIPIGELKVIRNIDYVSKNFYFKFYNFKSVLDFIESNKQYIKLKRKTFNDDIDLSEYNLDLNIENFYRVLLFELSYGFSKNELSEYEFLNKSYFIIEKFNKIFFRNILYKENNKFRLDFYRDLYRIKGKYDFVLNLLRLDLINVDFSTIHDVEHNLETRVLNASSLFNNFGLKSELNQFIQENINDFSIFIDKKIEDLYNNNHSFFYSLFSKNKDIKSINKEFPKNGISRSYFYSKLKKEPCSLYLKVRNKFPSEHKIIYSGKGDFYNSNEISFNSFLENLILEIFSSIIYESQNEYRNSKGIPNIGEGWVSETNLFYELKKYFVDYNVIHHGKPKWLGLQHVDIWFPKYNIGIEYQGKQHDEPIEFFGGEESFKKNKERDKRKKELFKENNSTLIEVREGYDLEKLINKISLKLTQ